MVTCPIYDWRCIISICFSSNEFIGANEIADYTNSGAGLKAIEANLIGNVNVIADCVLIPTRVPSIDECILHQMPLMFI